MSTSKPLGCLCGCVCVSICGCECMCVCMHVSVCEMFTLYLQGSITMTEFLYQNGGKLDVCDMSKKRGCLHHAVLKDDARLGGRGGARERGGRR